MKRKKKEVLMKQKILKNAFIPVITFFIMVAASAPTSLAQGVIDTIPIVTEVSSDWDSHMDSIKLGTTITLTVKNLAFLLKEAKSPGRKPILFIHDMPVKGLFATFNTGEQRASFYLTHTDESRATWSLIYKVGKPVRDVDLSIGWEDGTPIKTIVTKSLVLYRENAFSWIIGLLLLFIVVFVAIAWTTNVLRDRAMTPRMNERRMFSMGRTQMAWWFVLVFAAVTIVTTVTGELPLLPMSILTLLGIASGTALGAGAIDAKSTEDPIAKDYTELADQRDNLRKSIGDLKKTNPNDPVILQQETQVTTIEKKLKDIAPRLFSNGFLNDILSDNCGIEFHRLQVFVWTIFLGIIFLNSVVGQLTLKDFDSTMLALMGISSGTYLGFKLKE
jgi:hypothetical protein